MSKIICPPQSGRVGSVVYVNSRYGQIVRQFVPPRNPHTPDQQRNRSSFGGVSSGWRALTPEQRIAWCIAAADGLTVSRMGRSVPLNGYNYFVRVNAARARLGLGWLDLPPSVPSFGPNPVAELSIAYTSGTIGLKLHVPSLPGQSTLWKARPRSARVCVSCCTSPCWACCRRRWMAGATLRSFTSPATACRRQAVWCLSGPVSIWTAGPMCPK